MFKSFFINLLIGIVLLVALTFITMKILDWYTNHSEKIETPNFISLKLSEAQEIAKEKNVNLLVIDTVFSQTLAPGSVVRQLPIPHSDSTPSYVKSNRNIRISVVSKNKQMIAFPDFENNAISKKIAINTLKAIGLEYKLTMKSHKDKNKLLEARYNEKKLKAGDLVPIGERVILFIGNGAGAPVPMLNFVTGSMTIKEAEERLVNSSLQLVAQYDSCQNAEDSLNAIIYSQFPPYYSGGTIGSGSEITVRAKPSK